MTSTGGRTDQFGNFLADRKITQQLPLFQFLVDTANCFTCSVVSLSVCMLVTWLRIALCKKPIEMPFGGDSLKPKEPCTRWGAHWRRISGMLSSMSDRRQTDRVSLHWPPYSHSSRDRYDPYGGGDASCRYNSRSNLLVFYNSLLFVRCISTSCARWI